MDQTLSLYLMDTIPLLDAEAPDYAYDLLTVFPLTADLSEWTAGASSFSRFGGGAYAIG